MTGWIGLSYIGFPLIWIMLTLIIFHAGKGVQDKVFSRTKICLSALFLLTASAAICSLLCGRIKDGRIEIMNTTTLIFYYMSIQAILFELQVLYQSRYLNYMHIILPNIPTATLLIPYLFFYSKGHFASYYSLPQFYYAIGSMDEYVMFRLYLLLSMLLSIGHMVALVVKSRKEFYAMIGDNYTDIDNICVRESKRISYWTIVACIAILISNIFVSHYFEILIFFVLTILFSHLSLGFLKYKTFMQQLDEAMENEQNDDLDALTSTFNYQDLEGMIAPMVDAWTKLDTKPYLRNGITLQEAAEMMDVPRKDLSAYIRKILNINFFYWINTLRIEECKVLIREQKLNFTEIADKCGFADLATMSKAFKKISGVSPSTYKKDIKQTI